MKEDFLCPILSQQHLSKTTGHSFAKQEIQWWPERENKKKKQPNIHTGDRNVLKGSTLRNGAAELRFSQPISIIISCEGKTVSLRTCISSALMTIHLSGTLQSQSLYMCIEDLLSLSEHQKWFF